MGTNPSLQRALAARASDAVQERGRAYQRAGRAAITHAAPNLLEARVQGTHSYFVSVEYDDDAIAFDCSCPYAEGGALCKHVWATAIEADQKAITVETFSALKSSQASGGMTDEQQRGEEQYFVENPPAVPAHYWSEESFAARREIERWQELVSAQRHPAASLLGAAAAQTWYLIDLANHGTSLHYWRDPTLILHTAQRRQLKRGGLSKPTHLGTAPEGVTPRGVEGIVWALARNTGDGRVPLARDLSREVLPELCRLGRLGVLEGRRSKVTPLSWDAALPWRLVLDTEPLPDDEQRLSISGHLERETKGGRERLTLARVDAVLPLDLLVIGNHLCELESGHERWIRELSRRPFSATRATLAEMAKSLLAVANGPRFASLELADCSEQRIAPIPRLRLALPSKNAKLVRGSLSFAYGKKEAGAEPEPVADGAQIFSRDFVAETAAIQLLARLGVSVENPPHQLRARAPRPFGVKFDGAQWLAITSRLLDQDFSVEVEGKPYRRATGAWHPIIESEQDWFDVKGDVSFDGQAVTLPDLLRAARSKQHWVRLKDGSLGAIPVAWFESLKPLAELVAPRARQLRFHSSQAWMVESALSGAPGLETDTVFEAMKARLKRFQQIRPVRQPRGFRGELREYQRLALGWLQGLDELGFGGCLADDMGLGKTIVVLAWLLHRKTHQIPKARSKRAPSLLVVPKSLLFNWQREAERFTPSLRVLLHHGAERAAPGSHFQGYDVIVTSYGTLRRDVEALQKLEFDYVVLDEAHSIKNAWTEAHKAARCLKTTRRLALTGTPVENHLGELWNLLTFLNPEIFAALAHLRKTFERRRTSETALEQVIVRSLKPFILRRTKGEVAKDLPERIEKTLHVRLSRRERELYDGLANYYKQRILARRAKAKQIGGRGHRSSGENAKQTAEALEALLRLRQAACHPGLIDAQHASDSSAKLELLLDQLSALRAEGHKALVFSQFTKLLGLLGERLKLLGVDYAYLDGKTRDREREVERFQTQPELSVFLISLKAGGVGLNLVAADYVFLLDPWWNPASEAQAIDRAHRIGQRRKVIAYRLLSENTIEDKVAALQEEKRDLAAALFGDTANFSAKFTREDLEALLGG